MNPIDEAKALIARHEALVRDGDLDGILANAADDVVFLAPDMPLVEGKAGLRHLYTELLGTGAWDFGHDFAGADVIGDTVVLYGTARGTLTPPGEETSNFANNFMLTLRQQDDGTYRFWRGAFASSGSDT